MDAIGVERAVCESVLSPRRLSFPGPGDIRARRRSWIGFEPKKRLLSSLGLRADFGYEPGGSILGEGGLSNTPLSRIS